MSIVSMALSEEEKKNDATHSIIDDRPKYPHGLMIHVDKETFKKLGLEKVPQVGDSMKLLAMVEVSNVSIDSNSGDVKEPSMGLQIVAMEVGGEEEEKDKKTEDVLFGGE